MKKKKYKIQKKSFSLTIDAKVFEPTRHGLFFAENIIVNKGESVIDIGTGAGIFAILASKLGANEIYATDISQKAIENVKQNAKLNNANVKAKCGEFFVDIDKEFDLILVNLPQTLFAEKPVTENGVFGGKNGNEILLSCLRKAISHMKDTSRLYTLVYSLTYYQETFEYILEHYSYKISAIKTIEIDSLVNSNLEYYLHLNETGKILIFKKDGRWKANEYFVEITKK